MGIFSKFEGRMEDTFEGAANKMFDSPISPVQIAKKAEKKMRRDKMVGAGKQYAPTLYTVLVNASDDQRLFGYYPTLAGETETYLSAKAMDEGLVMDGQPLVRFIVDESLKRGKFEIIAELVASPIIEQLRAEEMDRYGIGDGSSLRRNPAPARPAQGQRGGRPQSMPRPGQAPYPYGQQAGGFANQAINNAPNQYPPQGKPPLPQVPVNEIDYSIDYGEYTFNSQDFDDYAQNDPNYDPDMNPAFASEHAMDSLYQRNSQPLQNDPLYKRTSQPLQNPAEAYNSIPQNFGVPIQPPFETPNTVVFAPGSGNAQPVPDNSMVRASLINTNDNRNFDLATARLLMGRDKGNDIVVDDINASRTHAELKFEPQGVWTITDLGSTNGTLVNGKEITTEALRDGDYITIGMTNYIFVQL